MKTFLVLFQKFFSLFFSARQSTEGGTLASVPLSPTAHNGKGVISLGQLWPFRKRPRRVGTVLHQKHHPLPTQVVKARRRAKGQHPRTGRKLAA